MLAELKQDLKNLITEDAGKALASLKDALSPESRMSDDCFALTGRWSALNQELIAGTIGYDQINTTRNQIFSAFIALVNNMKEEDLAPAMKLNFLIKDLTLTGDLGGITLVNCDRNEQNLTFWNGFEKRRNNHFQFYFINACNTQMPQSFAERLIYELVEFEVENDQAAISLRMDEQQNRVKIENLPMGPTQMFSEKKFKAYFCERFQKEFGEANQVSFEDFLATGIPKLPHHYIFSVFQVTAWANFLPGFFEWIVKSFTTTHAEVPTFIFFFPVMLRGYINNPGPPEHQPALNAIHALSNQYPSAAYIEPLPPVQSADLDNWLLQLGEGNPTIRQRVINALVDTFVPEKKKQFTEKNTLDMCDVELLQEKVHSFALSK